MGLDPLYPNIRPIFYERVLGKPHSRECCDLKQCYSSVFMCLCLPLHINGRLYCPQVWIKHTFSLLESKSQAVQASRNTLAERAHFFLDFICFFYWFIWERERERRRECKRGQRDKQTLRWVWILTQGSISRPWDQDLSWNQQPNA